MNHPPRMPDLPDLERLRKLAELLRYDKYAELQFVPFADHDHAFIERHLATLIDHERDLLAASAKGEPIVYAYSLCARHYARRLSPRQQLLAELFLHNRVLPLKRLRTELREYESFVDIFGGDQVMSRLRIVPVFDLLLLADPIASDDDRRVFLHNDSVQMARFVKCLHGCAGRVVADVGTGSGVLAAMACRGGAAQVLAVDINPRAVAFAAASFAINGCVQAQARLGSIAEVATQAELIISNPPYMSGRSALCLDGGGDDGLDIPRQFVHSAAALGRRLLMVLEADEGIDIAARLGAAPPEVHVLRRFAGRQLAVYEYRNDASAPV